MKSIFTDKIPLGTKFVALYGDGSAAELFHFDAKGILYDAADSLFDSDCQGQLEAYLADVGYDYWIELPQDFLFWYERAKE